jgi:two-component system sensor histidine kinase/response regulator
MLIVDDNKHACAVIIDMLKSMTFDAMAVESGYVALEEIKRAAKQGEHYKIVFLDWQMPEMDGIEVARHINSMKLSPAPHMVIVTAYGREEVIREAEMVGIEDVLIKPIGASILFDTVIHLLGANRNEQQESILEIQLEKDEENSKYDTDNPVGTRGARILLVEDNDLNQEVASEILRSVGCIVSLANDGAEAVKKVQEINYDLVLMDIQMPVMDGLTATQVIRKLPGFADLPIIAMTANAMKEDRDRCLAAGMNDYIIKPIDPDAMFATLRLYHSSSNAGGMSTRPTAMRAESKGIFKIAGIDTDEGLRRVIGNRALYTDLLKRFAEGQCDTVMNIQKALDGGDSQLAMRIAHSLKGISGNLGATETQVTAGELEAAIHNALSRTSIAGIMEHLSSILSVTLESINSTLTEAAKSEVPATASTTADGSLKDIIANLTAYAEKNELEALDYIESVKGDLFTLCDRNIVENLFASLKKYDFSTALGILKSLEKQNAE